MKINRRGFISLGLGATAGLTLSPLPYKLLDDVSIWTQNWPWVPVPKDGRESFIDSVCTLCPCGCEIIVRKIDERVISTFGRNGGICPLGLSGPQLLYTPTRVMSPMLRVNGGFQPVSWDNAISMLVSRLKDLQGEGEEQRLACLTETNLGTGPRLMKQFMDIFGSTGFSHVPSADDSWEVVTEKLTGRGFVPGYDLEGAHTIYSFGCAVVEGWGNPIRSMQVRAIWKQNGATLVQVEPRLSITAAMADRWVACKAGSEATLAFGLCHVMLEASPACRQRLANAVTKPDDLRELLRHRYSLQQVAAKTRLSEEVIESLAVQFVESSHPLAICGKGEGRSAVDSREVFATLLLNILAGSINKSGGLDCIEREYVSRSIPSDQGSLEALFETAATSSLPTIEVLLVAGANPYYEIPGSRNLTEAIGKIPFVVSFSAHWNETAMHSNLVLPVHSHLEGYRDIPVYNGLKNPKIGLSKPVSKRLFDSRYAEDILIETAARLCGPMSQAFSFTNFETYLQQEIGERWQELSRKGLVDLPLNRKNRIPVINFAAFQDKPVQLRGSRKEYPLILVPRVSLRLHSGNVGSSPFMMKTVAETVLKENSGFIDINPLTANDLKLSEGDAVKLTTPQTDATVLVHLDEGTAPGLVVMPQGLGHTAFDEYLAGKGVNVSLLLESTIDPVTEYPVAWGARAKLRKV